MTIYPMKDRSERIILGAPFLAATYMFVNYGSNNNTLRLGKSARLASPTLSSLKAIFPEGCKTNKESSRLSIGVIIGIVVGAIGLLLLIGLGLYFGVYLPRKRSAEGDAGEIRDDPVTKEAPAVPVAMEPMDLASVERYELDGGYAGAEKGQ